MEKKMKIAIFIDWYLPGTKAGGPVRSVFSLVTLLKKYFDFYIITTNRDLGGGKHYKEITPDELFLKDGVHFYYFDTQNLKTYNFIKLIHEIHPDVIYLNSFWSFNFSINLIRLNNSKQITAPIVLAPRGMLGKGAMGLKSFKKNLFVFLARSLKWYSNITFHATQTQEKNDILSKFKSASIVIAPNVNAGSARENASVKEVNVLKLFYLSRIAKVKNLNFALEILREIPLEHQIEYEIFGNLEDVNYWNECKEIIKNLPGNIQVKYQGEIKFDEVQDKLTHYNCLFLPTLNENYGHSIVESLLCGCPVIISDQTPWNDLEKEGAGFAIALTQKQKFVDAIIHYAKLDQQQFNIESEQAINYINKKIDINGIIAQYKTLFNGRTKN